MPAYPFRSAGTHVELFSGGAVLGSHDIGFARIRMTMTGDLRIRWHADHAPDLGPGTLSVSHPVYGVTDLATWVTSTAGQGEIDSGALGDASAPLTRLVVHWVNLPFMLPTAPLHTHTGSWAGRWTCEVAGWRLTLDARPDLAQCWSEVTDDRTFVISHTGELRRIDGGTFTTEGAVEVLHAWQIAFSFALGRWVAPALPVGFYEHRRVWEQWVGWRCDRAGAYYHWWDTHRADDLADMTRRFLEAWFGADHDVVRHLAHHLISANHAGTPLEARLMLVQSALEYLGWTTYVLTGRQSKEQYRKLHADDHIRQLLADASVPVSLPAELAALRAVAAANSADGPRAVTWMRNRLVHPKDAGEPYRVKHALLQAWQLSMHYGELLLLHRLGYRGTYLRRFPSGRWAHDHEIVPWAAPGTAT